MAASHCCLCLIDLRSQWAGSPNGRPIIYEPPQRKLISLKLESLAPGEDVKQSTQHSHESGPGPLPS